MEGDNAMQRDSRKDIFTADSWCCLGNIKSLTYKVDGGAKMYAKEPCKSDMWLTVLGSYLCTLFSPPPHPCITQVHYAISVYHSKRATTTEPSIDLPEGMDW